MRTKNCYGRFQSPKEKSESINTVKRFLLSFNWNNSILKICDIESNNIISRLASLPHSVGGSRILLWPPARLRIGNCLTHRPLSHAFFLQSDFSQIFIDQNWFKPFKYGHLKHFTNGKIQNFLRQPNQGGLPIFSRLWQ